MNWRPLISRPVWIWLVFAIFFLGMGFFYLYLSEQKIEQFDDPLAWEPLASNVNSFIRQFNKASHLQNLIAAIISFVSFGTAVFAMYLAWKDSFAVKGVRSVSEVKGQGAEKGRR